MLLWFLHTWQHYLSFFNKSLLAGRCLMLQAVLPHARYTVLTRPSCYDSPQNSNSLIQTLDLLLNLHATGLAAHVWQHHVSDCSSVVRGLVDAKLWVMRLKWADSCKHPKHVKICLPSVASAFVSPKHLAFIFFLWIQKKKKLRFGSD